MSDSLQRALLLNIPEEIETARLILRAGKTSDAAMTFEAVVESLNELKPWMPWVHPDSTIESITTYHSTVQAKWHAREMLDFQWIEKASGRLAGKGGFHHIDWAVPKLEIGYWLRTSMVGKGYCTEAVSALVAFAQHSLGAKRLEICNDPKNERSRRVAEHCGFTLEGILKKNMRDPYGALRDSCVYAKVFE
jgi:RimJ/RimL family protein N-acetyltransferase